mmetsp:Transcript_49319/g.56645  ORF Transcript_49319/g.56645 Transcript_49319/m.56645 type:complete len:161 (+) Transcript_49319:71-553(+)|eukprot:CAMPEP_0114978128 /NCGR_PEP_ID=MMETSP0216-20121206/3632_1 /TAXON_ID=223996 /ORGANISM="Protocruzia adherens, Strain Boccale" /LENGTH=160 /DNA_ID=CAMNT_0002339285 /DNA_START=46 /DNA_END=528 /DNA_ORIENTATION=-
MEPNTEKLSVDIAFMDPFGQERVLEEVVFWKRDAPWGYFASEELSIQDEKFLRWIAGFHFKELKVEVEFLFPSTYPWQPPQCKFVKKLRHPNITTEGHVCIPILDQYQWNCQTKMIEILEHIQRYLENPWSDDPIDLESYKSYTSSSSEFSNTILSSLQD